MKNEQQNIYLFKESDEEARGFLCGALAGGIQRGLDQVLGQRVEKRLELVVQNELNVSLEQLDGSIRAQRVRRSSLVDKFPKLDTVR